MLVVENSRVPKCAVGDIWKERGIIENHTMSSCVCVVPMLAQ